MFVVAQNPIVHLASAFSEQSEKCKALFLEAHKLSQLS